MAQAVAAIEPRLVMRFASAAARSSILTSPVEGMVAWLQDVNVLTIYNGSAWTNLLALTAAATTATPDTLALRDGNGVLAATGLSVSTGGWVNALRDGAIDNSDTTNRTLTASTATFTAVPSGVCTGTFVAPPSGRMSVNLTAEFGAAAGFTTAISVDVKTGAVVGSGTTVGFEGALGATLTLTPTTNPARGTFGVTRVLKGLTAGATYNYRVRFTNSAATSQTLYAVGIQAEPIG
jgi:hypothetical protein